MSDSADMSDLCSVTDPASRGEVPLKAIERELTCPMCKELYATPLLLPCQHSACRACIKDALLLLGRGSSPGGAPFQALAQEEQHGSQHSSPGLTPTHSPRGPKSPASGPSPCSPGSAAASPVGLAGPLPHADRGEANSRAQRPVRLTRERSFWKSGYATYPGHRRTPPPSPRPPSAFPCPVCQRDVELGERGLASLCRNFALEGVVERHRVARGGAIPCQACRPAGAAAASRAATKSCLDCKSSFCKACFKLQHPWGTPRAQHEFVAPTTSFRPKVLLCPEHEAERVTVYCEVCRRPLCHLCKLGGAHSNHKISSITNAYRTLKDKLSKSVAYLVSKEPEVRARMDDIDDDMRQVEIVIVTISSSSSLSRGAANDDEEEEEGGLSGVDHDGDNGGEDPACDEGAGKRRSGRGERREGGNGGGGGGGSWQRRSVRNAGGEEEEEEKTSKRKDGDSLDRRRAAMAWISRLLRRAARSARGVVMTTLPPRKRFLEAGGVNHLHRSIAPVDFCA
ncbi:E3 ubiquitin-protein ligase TRIM36-like [Lethenteron reissneri]|uniref:E3 ubiquitin-protein ligase TRIM36-like n=1 Tax=Lethenteron reissneri TaxID=7753 RepID=UPI002AB6B3DA|nr:E3 ubiquitin-protein ligase TRIM36-like [Lethenteron reissneri]